MNNSAKERAEAWKKIESQLQVADIILTKDKTLLSAVVRKGTESYWSHALVVFAVPNKETLFNNVLVISAEPHGIEIHRIQRYTKHFDFYDLGVKRVPGLSDAMREKVLAYVLNNVDIPYDYSRLFGFLVNYVKSLFTKKNGNLLHMHQSFFHEDAFICSSFIQKAFHGAMPEEKKDLVIFKEDRSSKFWTEEVTPADIARSKNCQWIYNERY